MKCKNQLPFKNANIKNISKKLSYGFHWQANEAKLQLSQE